MVSRAELWEGFRAGRQKGASELRRAREPRTFANGRASVQKETTVYPPSPSSNLFMRILVAEDERITQRILQALLHNWGRCALMVSRAEL